ncbi:hypothetical protein ACWGET_23395 [Streptomyces zaomyceticus]
MGELDEESDEWPDALFRLANALHSRFLAQGELGDIQEALPLLEEAIDKVDEGSWPGPLIAGHIGRCLVDRFTATGGREDLVTASRVIEAELTAAGDGDIDPEDLGTGAADGALDRAVALPRRVLDAPGEAPNGDEPGRRTLRTVPDPGPDGRSGRGRRALARRRGHPAPVTSGGTELAPVLTPAAGS